MTAKEQAVNILREHFAKIGSDQFREELEKYAPAILAATAKTELEREPRVTQLVLYEPRDVQIPLDAYLASALTGLGDDKRQLVFQLSDAISVVCKSHGITVYEPRKQTDPVHHPHVPDIEVFWKDRTRVLSSDLIIVLCHYPSFGAGEELDFAYSALVPTILVSHSDMSVSRMVTGIPALKVHLSYREPEDLRLGLDKCLQEIRPVLEQRKLAFSSYDMNIVGERVRTRREELELTRAQVATSVGHLTEEALKQIEESTDRAANPSLIQLREIATVLKTTVAELVEPDVGAQVLGRIEEWLQGETAARGGMTRNDRNRLVRRVLLRVLDSLEQDDANTRR